MCSNKIVFRTKKFRDIAEEESQHGNQTMVLIEEDLEVGLLNDSSILPS